MVHRGHQYYYDHSYANDATATRLSFFSAFTSRDLSAWSCYTFTITVKAIRKIEVKIIQEMKNALDIFNFYNEGRNTPYGTINGFSKQHLDSSPVDFSRREASLCHKSQSQG